MTVVKDVVQPVVSDIVKSVFGSTSDFSISQKDIIDLFSGGQPGAVWDLFDTSKVFQDRSATPSTPADIDDDLGTIQDATVNGNHLIAPSDAARQVLISENGRWARHTSAGSMVVVALSALVNMRFYGVINTTDSQYIVAHGSGTSKFVGVAQNGNSGATFSGSGTPVTKVDNITISPNTRDGLHDTLSVGSAKIVHVEDIAMSAWVSFNMGNYNLFELTGDWGNRVLIPESIAATSGNHELIYNFIAERYGLPLI